jgi:hypothetical protein
MAPTGRALKVELTADTADFRRDLDRAQDSTESFVRALEQAGRRGGDRFKRELGDAADEAGDDIREVGTEIGDEFAENIGEGFRAGDLTGSVIETMTSLVGSLKGPLGLFVGVGGGIVGALVSGFVQRQEELRQAGLAAGQTLAQAMQDGLTASELRSTIVDLISEAVGEGELDTLARDLEAAGSSIDEYVAALAAGGRPLDKYRQYLSRVIDSNTRLVDVNGRTVARTNAVADAAAAVRRALDEQSDAAGAARDDAVAYTDAMDGAKGTSDDAAAAIEKVNRKLARQAREARRARRAMQLATRDLDDYRAAAEGAGPASRGIWDVPLRRPRRHRRRGRRD